MVMVIFVCLLSVIFLYSMNCVIYRVIQKEGLNFVHVYFLNYAWYVYDLHNI